VSVGDHLKGFGTIAEILERGGKWRVVTNGGAMIQEVSVSTAAHPNSKPVALPSKGAASVIGSTKRFIRSASTPVQKARRFRRAERHACRPPRRGRIAADQAAMLCLLVNAAAGAYGAIDYLVEVTPAVGARLPPLPDILVAALRKHDHRISAR
jgi:hypothetical protein